ncbi:hypothetical protein G3260_003728 [Streptomyces albus]|uniref:hypothetical protein n=1 Tax=Streptomyces albus TaxID=1888 RepID=UPI0013B494C0|nr:hypothetical protein [Streptomyces albus]QID37329.1 hypothetical protein G3260_003728 [Streptomyces albus]
MFSRTFDFGFFTVWSGFSIFFALAVVPPPSERCLVSVGSSFFLVFFGALGDGVFSVDFRDERHLALRLPLPSTRRPPLGVFVLRLAHWSSQPLICSS